MVHLAHQQRLLLGVAQPVANVSGDLGSTDDCSRMITNWRNADFDVYLLAAALAPHRLHSIYALSAAQPGNDIFFFVSAVLGNEQRDRLADRLLSRVAEQALGAAIPTGNDAIERLAKDRVLRMIDDRRKPRQSISARRATGRIELVFHPIPLREPCQLPGAERSELQEQRSDDQHLIFSGRAKARCRTSLRLPRRFFAMIFI